MTIPKFKVGDRVGFKKGVYCPDELIIQEIRIKDNGIFYVFKLETNDIVMEVEEDELELIGDYTIVVKSGECGFYGAKKEDSVYCSHFRTKEKAEEAIVDLMTTQVTELMTRHKDLKDIESIDVSFKLKYIEYDTNNGSYLIQYEVKKVD